MKAAATTAQAVRERIAAHPAGTPFTPTLFAGMGSRAAIDQTLMRLTKEGRIERLGRGLYNTPRTSRFGLKTQPSPETVAQTLAASEGATIEIHGAEAARRFGLSTQVPAQPIFYTTGASRTVRLGKLQIRLRHVAARKLALAGRPAGQALSALWYLGRQQVTPATFEHIAAKLPQVEFEALRHAKASMPAWMLDALRRYEQDAGIHA
ncbi:DUF6088 family protein [Thiorhodovibrio frisius]|uniref:Uncharacterized protein n=1 Tax=Thiorhodovibrio frisius TaxID=631362 RepID=H8YVY6_9GAMM|nr:DUF6088 family protein [Thiorhodovibrio frisius]EIC23777.1 hypothetical protein Thi970DRAFT_00288 [Thiorhodovibrio frisius]WPL20192.1 hypothetical protein Thiofri_00262 [Thiorhodovibrio frisius]